MVIAETKRQMHETLEMKEEEIAQLRSRVQLATAQREELQEQKEKAEKSGEGKFISLPDVEEKNAFLNMLLMCVVSSIFLFGSIRGA